MAQASKSANADLTGRCQRARRRSYGAVSTPTNSKLHLVYLPGPRPRASSHGPRRVPRAGRGIYEKDKRESSPVMAFHEHEPEFDVFHTAPGHGSGVLNLTSREVVSIAAHEGGVP